MFLLALFFFWATAFCLPAPSGNTSAGIALRDFDDFSFKGIDWSLARSPGNCKAWQLEILHRATGVAVDMLNPKYWEDGGIDKNIGWVWFFRDENYKNEKNLPVSQGNGWRTRGDATHLGVYQRILYNMGLPYTFVLNGLRYMSVPSPKKLFYSCQESREPILGNCRPGVGAYTSNPSQADKGFWTITFCQRFWDQCRYIEDLVKPENTYLKPTDLNRIQPYERTLIHEFFHVDWMGFSDFRNPSPDTPHISDVVGRVKDGTQKQIYGATFANQFAWNFNGAVNLEVAENADTYALYFFANWVDRRLKGLWSEKYKTWDAPDPGSKGKPPPGKSLSGNTGNDSSGSNTISADAIMAM